MNETYENGKRRRRNLMPEDPMLISLMRRCILEKELQQLLSNNILLECATNGIRDFDLTDELYNLRNYFLQHKFSGNQLKGKSIVKHITYDNSSGLIDMRIVESEIQNKILG